MRRKIVLWGNNEKDQKILVALELLEKENLVNIYTFPENVATEEFYKAMSEKWREDEEVEFPTEYSKIERKLSVSDSLLPDEIKVERPEVITRAQAEWHFVVLSSKLYELYKSELEDIKDKIDGISQFDNTIWEELKGFWTKVQGQVNDRNLFREQGAALRERVNTLFDKLKELKKSLEEEFETQSNKYAKSFYSQIEEIESKVDEGLGLSPLFEDLKKLQAKIKEFKFTKEDRNEVWNKIDNAFKKIREKRGSSERQTNNNLSRLESRYNGLLAAIQKMQKSIDFDKKELEFQEKKVADSDGQLESQLRVAKIKILEEKINSKEDKLADMNATKTDLESRMEKEKKRAIKAEKREKIEEAKEVVKQKIAEEIAEQNKEMDKMADKLEKAAEELTTPKKQSFFSKISDSVEQLVDDVVDTAKAVADVVEDKIESAMDKAEEIADLAEDRLEDIKDKGEEHLEKVISKAGEIAGNISEKLDKMSDKVEDKVEAVAEDLAAKASEIKDKISDQLDDDEKKDA